MTYLMDYIAVCLPSYPIVHSWNTLSIQFKVILPKTPNGDCS